MSTATFTIPEGKASEGYMGATKWEGGNLIRMEKEGKNIGVSNITKEIRKDIKDAVKAGFLPRKYDGHALKYSVRKSSFSITVTITVEGAISLETKTYHRGGYVFENDSDSFDSMVVEPVKQIMHSYLWDDSNSQVDYFNRNFYPSVCVVPALDKEAQSSALIKAIKPLKKSLGFGRRDPLKEITGPIVCAMEKDEKLMKKYNDYLLSAKLDKVVQEFHRTVRKSDPRDALFTGECIDIADEQFRAVNECREIIENFVPVGLVDHNLIEHEIYWA